MAGGLLSFHVSVHNFFTEFIFPGCASGFKKMMTENIVKQR
jgi:hypothetical protein